MKRGENNEGIAIRKCKKEGKTIGRNHTRGGANWKGQTSVETRIHGIGRKKTVNNLKSSRTRGKRQKLSKKDKNS